MSYQSPHQEMKLSAPLFEKIKKGQKAATTRKGIKDIRLGELVFFDPVNDKTRLKVWVHRVELIKFSDIWETDRGSDIANSEGHTSCQRFAGLLEGIYGPIDDDQTMTVISFSNIKDHYFS